MLRLSGTRSLSSSSSSSSSSSPSSFINIWPLNRAPRMASDGGNYALAIKNSDSPWANSISDSSFNPPNFLPPSIPDHQSLLRNLEASNHSSNLRTANETHAKIIKLGYRMSRSFLSSPITTYISCGSPALASQLLNETLYWDFDLISANMIITAFMKRGEVDIAKKVFRMMPTHDVVSWNSVIGGCVKNTHFEEALNIFEDMLSSNIEPDRFTFASIITACARIGGLSRAKRIHDLMIEKRIPLNYILASALINMYSRCGSIKNAKQIFEATKRNDVSIWNSMINGLAIHGLASEAIALFPLMEFENILPDSTTFLGILTACSHCGLIEQGRKYFNLMRCRLVEPQLEHYGAMVDLLGRAGHLDEAYVMIKEMPMEPDIVIWRAFLSSCTTQKNSNFGEVAIKKIEHPKSGDYVLLSNIYCCVNQWDSAERLRNVMKNNRVRKSSGKSWIEISGKIQTFQAGDLSHLEKDAIYKVLAGLIRRTKMEGFIPMKELVMMDVSDEEKEGNLSYHSEKLALACGVLKTSPGTEIRIMKNLRTCLDCHCWLKFVSRILNRVIIVRDRIRFHRFEGGVCTCGDYW